MSDHRRAKAAEIRHILETEGPAVRENTTHFNEQRYNAIDSFDQFDALRAEARSIKEAAIETLPTLLETVTDAVEANGGMVYLADDAADANNYIETVMTDVAAETVVKSKSMTTEEIELNDHLQHLEIDVYETDLGEFVLQVADESPSHLIGPAIHKSRESIAALFNDRFDPPDPLETSEELTAFARDYLGEQIKTADVGITGANFVLAESGTVVLVTNEGNARKTAVVPDIHIAVTGIEKLLPSLDQLGPFIELIAKTGTGQDIAQYVTMLSPPVDSPTISFAHPDQPNFGGRTPEGESGAPDREFHLVLIDNGRESLRNDADLRETLYCIRCGACANSCANFQTVGGHVFGGETYTGGIASGWETGVNGLDSAAEFNELCTGCTRCVPACPVNIDIPWINTVVRDRINHDHEASAFDSLVSGLIPDGEPSGISVRQRLFGQFDRLATLGSKTAPVSNWILNSGVVRAGLDRWVGIDRRRSLPTFKRESFREWVVTRDSPLPDGSRSVVIYPDIYTNYVRVGRGKALVRVLEALGIDVIVPDVSESGRAPLSQGMIQTARDRASQVYTRLEPYLGEGRHVVVLEPSDLAMFTREYSRLLDDPSATRLASSCYDVFEYLSTRVESGDLEEFAVGTGERVVFHGHCQQRTLKLDVATRSVLTALGYEVTPTNVECCGMAGSFGYKSEFYEVSAQLGQQLGSQIDNEQVVVASGTSCIEQLEAHGITDPMHPIELIDPDRS